MELPRAFDARMRRLLGAEYDALIEALGEEAVKGLRVNGHKVAPLDFEAASPFSLCSLPYVEGGYIVSRDAGAGKHPYHHAGVYYMQDPGAMATVAALPLALFERRGLRILDLCAAPGGKTTQLAAACAMLGGVVVANEYVSARARILAGNVERMGLSNVCVTNLESMHFPVWYPDFFDLVVVDAPCSGEGMFRKDVPAVEEWSEENVAMCATRQKEILENGARSVAPGGMLLYSTCTYSTEENEEVVLDFLRRHPDFSLVPCREVLLPLTADGIAVAGSEGIDLSLCRRFYPHRAPGEGQFIALLLRDADASGDGKPCADARRAPAKGDLAVLKEFLWETVGRELDGVCLCGGMLSYLEEGEGKRLPIPPFGVLSVGCTLGEVRKGRFLPHHHFFTAFGGELRSRVCLSPDGEEVHRYLLGEEIAATDAQGYTAVLLSLGEKSVTLGGGKASQGRLKNHYPKGLRCKQ